jgi:hypothetical protein
MNETFRCHLCGDIIGVYEPTVVLSDGQARSTSRAAEQGDPAAAGDCYHQACYMLAHGERHPG